MPSDLKVLCFIPMRNCQSTIGPLLARFNGKLSEQLAEILVVDNASTDSSIDEARKGLAALSGVKVTLLQNSRNYGLGGSHKIAFNYARENGYDYLFVVHGDNSADPNQFEAAIDKDLNNFDLILSDRLSGHAEKYPIHRWFFNWFLSKSVSLLTLSSIRDFGGGPINIYRVSSFLNPFENPIKNFSNSVDFSQYALLYGIFRRLRISFRPLSFTEQEAKPFSKLLPQFLKPLFLSLRYRIAGRKTIAPDLKGTFFGHTFLRVKIDPAGPIAPPSPKPRKDDPEILRLLDLEKTIKPLVKQSESLPEIPGMELAWLKVKLEPRHFQENLLEPQVDALLRQLPPERIIFYINADEVAKTKQCYDFLAYCLDRGIEPQLISGGVGDIKLWRNYGKFVKNLTLTYMPGTLQRSFFFDLCREVAPLGNLSVNVVSDQEFFYHTVGLKKELDTLGCRSVLLQPYFLKEDENLPEDHMNVLLDQTAVVHTWFKNNVFRKHTVYTFGQALKDKNAYESALAMGFMDMAPRKISREKIWTSTI